MKEQLRKKGFLKNKEIAYPCVYAISAGMVLGPVPIPEEYKVAEEMLIGYVLELMKTSIKNRAVIRWDKDGNKKATQFWRDENGNPYFKK